MRRGIYAILGTMFLVASPALADTDAEPPTHPKKTKKIMAMLEAVGLNDPAMLHLIQDVNDNMKDGYLSLYEERIGDGKLVLHYELSGGVKAKQAELRFTPDDSNMMYTVRTNAAMASYQLRF